MITPICVIDTVGPVITGVFFNRLNGQVDYTSRIRRRPSGVNTATLLDSANYLFTKVHANKAYPGKWIVTNITVTPEAAANSYDVAVTFNSGETMRGGFYLFTIRDSSQRQLERAGHRRQPSRRRVLRVVPLGQHVIKAAISSPSSPGYHNKIFAPQTIMGTANARQRRRRRPAGRCGAQRHLHARHPARRQPGLHQHPQPA